MIQAIRPKPTTRQTVIDANTANIIRKMREAGAILPLIAATTGVNAETIAAWCVRNNVPSAHGRGRPAGYRDHQADAVTIRMFQAAAKDNKAIPTATQLAERLGCTRQAAHLRIKALASSGALHYVGKAPQKKKKMAKKAGKATKR